LVGARALEVAVAWDHRVVTEPPVPRQRPQYFPIYDKPGARYLLPTFGAVGCALAALVVLFVGGLLLVHTIELATRGVVVRADVVAARHGSKSDYVTVRLPPPADQQADLIAWSGAPSPGDTISVRYDPASPQIASQAGQWPWLTLSLSFFGAGFFAFGSWWEASRPWRRQRRRVAT
jgi:hypothetical protein